MTVSRFLAFPAIRRTRDRRDRRRGADLGSRHEAGCCASRERPRGEPVRGRVLPAAARRRRHAARGESRRGARLFRGGARSTRPAHRRRATEIALARACAACAGTATLWATLDPAAERPKQVLAALAAAAPAARRRPRRVRQRLEGAARKGLSDAALTGPGAGAGSLLQLNRFFGGTQERRQPPARPRAGQALSQVPEAHSPSRLPRSAAAYRRAAPTRPRWTRSTARSRSSPTGNARRSSRPSSSPAIASPARRPFSRSSSPPIPQPVRPPARSRSSMSSRSDTPTRGRMFQRLWDGDRKRARIRIRRRRALDADEGLGRGRVAVQDLKRADYGENGARRALSRADRRGERPLPGSDRALQGGAGRRARMDREAARSPR